MRKPEVKAGEVAAVWHGKRDAVGVLAAKVTDLAQAFVKAGVLRLSCTCSDDAVQGVCDDEGPPTTAISIDSPCG
jgi:hypothetical protein